MRLDGGIGVVAVLLAACGLGVGGGDGGVGVGGGTITVSGVVTDETGLPVGGATVVLLGRGPTTTGLDGRFSFSNVTPPYDAASVVQAGTRSSITVYRGLTRADPRLLSIGYFGPLRSTSKVQGTLSGSVMLPSSDRRTVVAFEDRGPAGAQGTGFVVRNPYEVEAFWPGSGTVTGTVHALQWRRDSSGAPSSYDGYGRIEGVSLLNAATVSGRDIALGPVNSGVIRGSTAVPPGFTPASLWVDLVLGATTVQLFSGPSLASWSFRVPDVPGASLAVYASATLGEQDARSTVSAVRVVSPTSTGSIDMALPAQAPVLSLPLDRATGIDLSTQVFSWAAMPQTLSVFVASGPNTSIYVLGTAGQVTLPSTTELGLGNFPSGSPFNWSVLGTSEWLDSDAIADPGRRASGSSAPRSDRFSGTAGLRSFTTQ